MFHHCFRCREPRRRTGGEQSASPAALLRVGEKPSRRLAQIDNRNLIRTTHCLRNCDATGPIRRRGANRPPCILPTTRELLGPLLLGSLGKRQSKPEYLGPVSRPVSRNRIFGNDGSPNSPLYCYLCTSAAYVNSIDLNFRTDLITSPSAPPHLFSAPSWRKSPRSFCHC